MKNQNGITLIALVITIIVLLILAGISIAMLTGDNGILTQANNSKYNTARAEAVEKINLALNAVKTEVYSQRVSKADWSPVTGTGSDADLQTVIKTILSNDKFVVSGTDDEGNYIYKFEAKTEAQDSYNKLTLSYYSKEKANLTSNKAIKGSINLDTLELSSASLPTE